MSQAIANHAFHPPVMNPISEYQAHARKYTPFSAFLSVVIPEAAKVLAVTAGWAVCGGFSAISGIQTTQTSAETKLFGVTTGIQTTLLGIGSTCIASVVSAICTHVLTRNTVLKNKAPLVAVAATILGSIISIRAAAATKQFGELSTYAILAGGFSIGGTLLGLGTHYFLGIAPPEITTAFVMALAVSGPAVGMGATSGQTPGDITFSGAVTGALFGFGLTVIRAILVDRNDIGDELLAREQLFSRTANFPFFKALFINFLNTLPEDAKEVFIDNYQSGDRDAFLLFAKSYIKQLINTQETLTEDNTPEFFHEKHRIGGREMTLLEAINELKTTKNTLQAPELQRKIKAVSSRLLNIVELNPDGLRFNPAMPNSEEVSRIRALYFPPQIRII